VAAHWPPPKCREHLTDVAANMEQPCRRSAKKLAQSAVRFTLQLEGGAADVFGPGGGNGAAQPAVDLKSLHAKIGELTLENDFLEGALNKAGLLSAKR
jgi:hypothetical protein